MMSEAIRIRRRSIPSVGGWPDAMHPVLCRVYASRGVGPDEARLALEDLVPPDRLPGLARAVELLDRAIDAGIPMLVVGDFDADGATGTALAVRGLRLLGARDVGFRVPHRMHHGYGLSPALVADIDADACARADTDACAPGARRPGLLLTVDSGVACHAGVAAARALGMQVIVTDHHLPGETLPEADALVNPCLPGSGFPSPALAGVGVVFYLLLALRRHRRDAGRYAHAPEPDLGSLLDLVAFGTVADMVPLDRNNRILIAAGLRRMRAGRCQPGVMALAEVAGRELAMLSAGDIGYALAPRLNAAGRLEDMGIGIACLLAEDAAEARALATRLHDINGERRELQRDMLEHAEVLVAGLLARGAGFLPAGVCVHDAGWHPGVVGLVASRLKDRLHRPVVALAPGGDGQLRGSARSIPGVHVRDVLADVASRRPGLVARFGGHAMAAGLSLAPANLDAFAALFAECVAARVDADALAAEILSDGELDGHDHSRALAEVLRDGGPWGQAFPEPVFDGEFDVREWRCVGTTHLRMRVQSRRGGDVLTAIEFGGWRGEPPPGAVRLAYLLQPDDWGERRGVQLVVRHREAL